MDVEIEILGPMAVRCGGAVQHLQSAQARVAFARLVLAGPEGVTRDELADVIWPGDLPPTWASALRTLVSRLRAFVGPLREEPTNPLVKLGGRYVLTLGDGVRIDVQDAPRAVAAAQEALDAGDVVAAARLATRAADRLRFPFLSEYEGDWVAEQRRRLAEYLVTALEIAGRAALEAGDRGRAALLAEEAAARAPERESVHRCLMAVRGAMGNRGEALRVYQRLRRYLAEHLGVDPSPETEAAYLALLGPSSASSAPGGGAAVRHRPVPFVGRRRERATLACAWDRAVRGRRQFVLITGESGIGKTRLLREAGAAMAAGGGLLLVGRCDEGSTVPYQPLVEALDSFVAASPDDPLDAVGPAARDALRLLLPSLGGPCPPGELPEQPALFAALTELLLAAASEPCAVLIDDAHWADPQTVALLRHLMRATADTRLCLVAAARDDLPTPARRAGLDEAMLPFEHAGDATEVALGGLDLAATRALVHKLAGGAGADAPAADPVRRVYARSGGNPFMLLELLRHRAGSGAVPPAVTRLVAAKQAAVGQDATRLLQVAAVTGSSVGFDTMAGAAGLDVLAALDALEALLRAGILAEVTAAVSQHPDRPANYEFRHDVVRQAVDEQLSDARRRHVTSWQRAAPGRGRDTGPRLSRAGAERL
ncbi:AAA family ATPase [Streptomyces sp. CC224B]|uniref:AAA family ATPase n=1 Tax=Streptomyces sp. CC224B TaxID=3044571 RepID=UPI0024A7F6CA|nr:AAA family ATPase [Streptomyces sp. CC224B]